MEYSVKHYHSDGKESVTSLGELRDVPTGKVRKVRNNKVLSIDKNVQRYKRPDTLCKITIANIKETRAREKTRKLMPLIKSHFNISFKYDFN